MGGRPADRLVREAPDDLRQRYLAEGHPLRRQRLRALWLLRRGDGAEEVAEEVGISARTLQRWMALYRAGGTAEVLRRLPGHQAKGRLPRLTADQRAVLADRLRAGAFPTVAAAVGWVRDEWGVAYTYKGMHALLRRLGRAGGAPPDPGACPDPPHPGPGACPDPPHPGPGAGRSPPEGRRGDGAILRIGVVDPADGLV